MYGAVVGVGGRPPPMPIIKGYQGSTLFGEPFSDIRFTSETERPSVPP
jgi:hypothetical protein